MGANNGGVSGKGLQHVDPQMQKLIEEIGQMARMLYTRMAPGQTIQVSIPSGKVIDTTGNAPRDALYIHRPNMVLTMELRG